MGLMRKAVRRATPRPVRKVKRVVTHPVRTTVRAATPRPIRQAQRQVFNATHPINTLENAFLDSLTGSPRSRKRATVRSSSGTVARSTATGASSSAAAYERAVRAEAIAQAEQRLFSHHLAVISVPDAVAVPPLGPPDIASYRTECRRVLCIEALENELSAFAEPPVAPAPSLPTVDAEADRLYRLAVSDVSRLRVGERRRVRAATREQAREVGRVLEAEAKAHRAQEQADLDAKFARLVELRTVMTDRVEVWRAGEVTRLETERAQRVAEAEERVRRLRANDPSVVTPTLKRAVGGERVAVKDVTGVRASIELTIPNVEEIIGDEEPAVTAGGRPTIKARSKTRRNQFYAGALASELLRIARTALSVAPGIQAVHLSVFEESDAGVRPIYEASITRDVASGSQCNTADPDLLAGLLHAFADAEINDQNRTHELKPIFAGVSPGAQHARARERDQPLSAGETTSIAAEHAPALDARAPRRFDTEAFIELEGHLDPSMVPMLEQHLHDPNTIIRRRALDYYLKLNGPDPVAKLLAAIQDPEDGVRSNAFIELEGHLDPSMVPMLEQHLHDPNTIIRRRALDYRERLRTA
jgi:hypothetical protein